MEKKVITTESLRYRLEEKWPDIWKKTKPKIYGVPRGGWGIASVLDGMGYARQVSLTTDADVIVDDIIDSGETKKFWNKHDPMKPFWAPFDKTQEPGLPWIVFPWEQSGPLDAEELVRRMLQFIGEDPTREGLKETPNRVVRSWGQLFNGYGKEPADILSRTFASDNDAMVICKNIEFYSMCEHHLIPFFGAVAIGYIPNGKVVGLSKLARLVEIYARRLQLQEQLTSQIAKALATVEGVTGVGVVVEAKHLCMCARGVEKQGSSMVTSAMLGTFRDDPAVRSEFLKLIKN